MHGRMIHDRAGGLDLQPYGNKAEEVIYSALTLEALVAHLRERKVSVETLPEHLVIVDKLPRSSGGKIAKAQLRQDIKTRLGRTSRRKLE